MVPTVIPEVSTGTLRIVIQSLLHWSLLKRVTGGPEEGPHWAGGALRGRTSAAAQGLVPGVPLSHGSQNHRRSGYSGDEEVNPALLCDAKSQLAGKAKGVSGPPDPLLFQLPCLFPFCQEEDL